MKKRILFVAIATLALAMTACSEKENFENSNNETPEFQAQVKSAADLIGTEWTYSIDTVYVDIEGDTVTLPLDMQFGLSFDSTYAHLSFPENITISKIVDVNGAYTMEEIEGINYAYTYDPTTHTGSLTAYIYDNLTTCQLPFTYDVATDNILIDLNVSYEGNPNIKTYHLVFHRNI